MYVWLNLKTIKFYLIKIAPDFYWQPSYVLGERASFDTNLTTAGAREKVTIDLESLKFKKLMYVFDLTLKDVIKIS